MAKKLPLEYSKASYEWCLDFKHMGKQCEKGKVARRWTEEEKMAYLDWNDAEDARVEGAVMKDVEANGLWTEARGPGYLLARAERDDKEQMRLYEE
jgi:hypothetical protein